MGSGCLSRVEPGGRPVSAASGNERSGCQPAPGCGSRMFTARRAPADDASVASVPTLAELA